MAGSDDLTKEDRRSFEPSYRHRVRSYQKLNGWVDPEAYNDTEHLVMLFDAGFSLDELVAKHIMGWEFRRPTHGICCTCQHCGRHQDDCPGAACEFTAPEADIGPVLRRMRELGWWAELKTPFGASPDSLAWAGFTPLGVSGWDGRPDYEVGDLTLPLAVCKAALLAVLDQEG
jgi:hypothetical protein